MLCFMRGIAVNNFIDFIDSLPLLFFNEAAEDGERIMSKKEKTIDQAAAMQEKAIRFLRDVVGDDDKADEIEGLTVSEYADRKGLTLINPAPHSNVTPLKRSKSTMATAASEFA